MTSKAPIYKTDEGIVMYSMLNVVWTNQMWGIKTCKMRVVGQIWAKDEPSEIWYNFCGKSFTNLDKHTLDFNLDKDSLSHQPIGKRVGVRVSYTNPLENNTPMIRGYHLFLFSI